MEEFDDYEKYLELEEAYRPKVRAGRRPRAGKNSKSQRNPGPTVEVSDFVDDPSTWVPTYVAPLDDRHHERQWVVNSVAPFYRNNQITDVTRRVKGGKEANVYCCTAHPATGVELIAAKLYRPRMLRTLKNDAIYKAGRQLRDEEGKQLKGRREKLAISQKTRFGKHLDMVWWIGNEFRVQHKLFEAGANVPRPIAHEGNTILMEYIGDESFAAPTLIDVSLGSDEAAGLFLRTISNIQLIPPHHIVHGDLSAFNILYWEERLYIIDFPQVVDARLNPNAFMLLTRDVERVCGYFLHFGVRSDSGRISNDLWFRYMGGP
jgi:RIO kinase 1